MNKGQERSPRKAKGQGVERREEILAAALRLFTQLGVHAVSTRQIAQAVGISQPTLYAYFPTKADIGMELHSRAFALLAQGLASGADRRSDTPEGFVAMLRIYVDFGLQNPDMYRIAFMSEGAALRTWWRENDPTLSPSTASTYGVLRREMTEMHARGLTVDVDPETLTQSVWSGMHGLVSLMIAKPGFPWVEREALINAHLWVIVRGVLKAV
ncbi:TetR/AcrR family transcriptional regulator [Phenylobacterium sp.]|uniref:TetR/AcrR family transcriptional regulator n=1 Tax=Phenylobacterium sp. TaxID=1871053 RepID=UPI00286A44EC|nr:TetR/AcrR family transcriptional regulator [Phenylobacterium sp.]